MKLHGRIPRDPGQEPRVLRVTERCDLPPVVRDRTVLLQRRRCDHDHPGFAAVLALDAAIPAPAIPVPDGLSYLREGDIVRINAAAGELHVMYRRSSPHNSVLITERCNSKCLMCSQPPKDIDDSFHVDDILRAIPLMSTGTAAIGITGGEPTLLGDKFLGIIKATKDHLPSTALHILSNGRLFSYLRLAQDVARIGHPDLMFGIPVYSDVPSRHDFVVQARGAFDETIRGIMNLARMKQRVEIRIVLHRETTPRLAATARFIARSLPFVEKVALMGLEPIGFARPNWNALWIDPVDYQQELSQAVAVLNRARIRVDIYNHQLCTLSREMWPYAVKSISDWKNIYIPECEGCAAKHLCGGFFAWADRLHSRGIRALTSEDMEAATIRAGAP